MGERDDDEDITEGYSAHHSLLARLDERVRNLERRAADWITKDQFWATRVISLGIAAAVLLGVVTAILSLVIKR
jgi:negative regulator of sigma E activity